MLSMMSSDATLHTRQKPVCGKIGVPVWSPLLIVGNDGQTVSSPPWAGMRTSRLRICRSNGEFTLAANSICQPCACSDTYSCPVTIREKRNRVRLVRTARAIKSDKASRSIFLRDSISDFRSPGFVLDLNDWDVGIQSFEICLLALLGFNCGIEVVANSFPRAGTVSQRIPQEVRTGEIGGAAPTSEIDLLVAPSFALAYLPIECDCHVAS